MNDSTKKAEFTKPELFESKTKKPEKKKKWLLRLILILAITIPIIAFAVVKGLMMILPQAKGDARAEKTVILQMKVEGYLSKVHVLNSQSVKKDEALLEFENQRLGLDLEESVLLKEELGEKLKTNENKLEHVQKGIERAQVLFENDIVSKFEVEGTVLEEEKTKGEIQDLKRELQVVEQKIASLKEQKDSLVVKAPFDGIFLGELSEREGTYFQRGETFGIFFSPEKFFLESEFLEKDSVRIKVGDRSEISFKAFPGAYYGEVIEVEEKAKEVVEKVYKIKNVIKVKILLNDFPQGLKPGMQADVKILGRSKGV